jgi:uncharacterized membrane protein YoaK (UPF0700 family)
MFRHKGKNRTFIHNLRLATLLSFVAGIVNITGVLAVKTLTTNVTGHFAYFAEELMRQDYSAAITFFVFTLFFLLGAFTSNLISEFIAQRHPNTSHIIPIILEITLLAAVAFFGTSSNLASCEGKSMAFAMLFAMGIQNSLVTKISQSTVRTTHLTGLFTDLGIELSQLFFYKKIEEKKKLKTNIYLRFSIISFFFIGCVLGGYLFKALKLKRFLWHVFFF